MLTCVAICIERFQFSLGKYTPSSFGYYYVILEYNFLLWYRNNTATKGGGFYFNVFSDITTERIKNFENLTIEENQADFGGGIYFTSTALSGNFTFCFLSRNQVSYFGGAIFFYEYVPVRSLSILFGQ